MPKLNETGVFQQKNGTWGFRYGAKINGKRVDRKRTVDENGNPFILKSDAVKARKRLIERELSNTPEVLYTYLPEPTSPTIEQVYKEYCANGREGKAYSTLKKQDSLWNNHIQAKFGNCPVNEISVAEINSFLETLYFKDGRAYAYVESFLKMFYLIFGQAYSRNYLSAEQYSKLCQNKYSKISMPKRMVDDEQDIVVFTPEQTNLLDNYFNGKNAETAYLIGKYCGLRINECYGLKWENVDFENSVIRIEQQLQYQNGVIKLVGLKTRCAKRNIFINNTLQTYLLKLKKTIDKSNIDLSAQREQNQTMIVDKDGQKITSLSLVNTLPNGKMQTDNSMKYYCRELKNKHGIAFKYHYLRHTYGTNLASLNTPMHILCNQMGHSSGNVTQKYYLGQSQNGIEVLKENLEKIK